MGPSAVGQTGLRAGILEILWLEASAATVRVRVITSASARFPSNEAGNRAVPALNCHRSIVIVDGFRSMFLAGSPRQNVVGFRLPVTGSQNRSILEGGGGSRRTPPATDHAGRATATGYGAPPVTIQPPPRLGRASLGAVREPPGRCPRAETTSGSPRPFTARKWEHTSPRGTRSPSRPMRGFVIILGEPFANLSAVIRTTGSALASYAGDRPKTSTPILRSFSSQHFQTMSAPPYKRAAQGSACCWRRADAPGAFRAAPEFSARR